ncbi:energy transducer TonB [Kordia sp. YSTF-M3]|uniref:Energy transducer TonB n=1 Tax=Kordia aestuariivivens TaxID=2759037 RepID=A0ABR7Q3U6_9FLAO|nr:energy transducer TonB [Kordia aestuariivivens]MBC8753226.1 energy transducer TonB [Kordia aestuariivivens]
MMKKYLFTALLFSLVFVCNAQDSFIIEQKSTPPPPPPIVEGCEEEEYRSKCGVDKLNNAAFEALKATDIEKIIGHTQKDIIFMKIILSYDIDKKLLLEDSSIKFHESKRKSFGVPLSFSLNELPFALSSTSFNQEAIMSSSLFLKIDRANKKLIPLYNYKPKRKSFSVPDKFAIYPGCEDQTTFATQRKCFGSSISKHVSENFDFEVVEKLDIEGVVKMYASFSIAENGSLTNVNVRAPHPMLAREVERIIKMLPEIKPASLRDTPVSIPYTLPIVFKVN